MNRPGLLGAPLAGVAIAWIGLASASLLNSVTFLIMLVVLLILGRHLCEDAIEPAERALLRRAAEGLSISFRDPLLRTLLVLTIVAAGCLLPVTSLLLPLHAREHRWPARTAGQIVGAQAFGAGLVAVTILLRNTSRRPGIALAAGLLLAGLATLSLSVAPTAITATASGLVVGIGLGVFGSHVGPLLLGSTPHAHLSRVQAVLMLAQALPLILTLNIAGSVADHLGAGIVIASCGAITALAGLTGPSGQVRADRARRRALPSERRPRRPGAAARRQGDRGGPTRSVRGTSGDSLARHRW